MKHMITVKEVQDYLNVETWEQCACSFGDGSAKKLDMNNVTGAFRVTDHDDVKYLGSSLPEAVAAYNAAT